MITLQKKHKHKFGKNFIVEKTEPETLNSTLFFINISFGEFASWHKANSFETWHAIPFLF